MASEIKRKPHAKKPESALEKLAREIHRASSNAIAADVGSQRLAMGALKRDEFGMVSRKRVGPN